ncbi:proline dehydrogenase 2, mitochondrial-like isoform X1 [Quercus lobata]|uniref:Proline dehydrogenase n=1 Tax=Quercus lobata TaxID=97700 RepID=A0A7N2KXB4_QUELO|nr:proline dehydrogenase 2, mitochondrial-like isoform X1 [Quercus lobata]XP_030952752.1 proline dehydrogenase 2, mitochondrial-like isoform X1 [Quercus lobata]
MAARVVSPSKKLLKSLCNGKFFSTRPLNTSSPSSSISINLTTEKQPPIDLHRPTNTASLDLHDVEKLFSSVTTTKLLRASANLQMAAMGPMVDFGMWVMNSKLMDIEGFKEIVLGFVKHTFYEHFCAGEDALATGDTVRRLHNGGAGLRAMLDYAVEYAGDNQSCDRNLEAFLRTVEIAKSLPPSSVSFVIVKISAICPLKLLERVSDLLRWQHKNPSFNLAWKMDTLPILSDISPTYHTLKEPEPLTLEEEHDLQLGHQRLLKICQNCLVSNVPLTIDAEHTSVQPAIDYLTYSSAIMYNKDDNILVYGTIQAYLKDAKERLLRAYQAADEMGVPVGIKLVRGAYMSSERKLASSLGFESPIHNSIQETHTCYNNCASFMLNKIANGPGALVLATHNTESGRIAVGQAHDLGIGKVNQKLEFAQLYGMSDALSFGLRNAGFQVSKYMPFGPVEIVMSYLLRRAEENRGLLSTSTLDRQLMRNELKRRLKGAIF